MYLEIIIVPLILTILGIIMYKYPPKKINYFVGYRTKNSFKNIENWEIANKYSSKLLIILGLITTIITLIIYILILLKTITYTETLLVVITLIQILPLFLIIYLTERKIKK